MTRSVTLADGRATVCERTGSTGPPVLALHGMTSSAATWRPFARRLEHTLSVHAFDQRGHGAAADHPGPYALEDSAADAMAVARASGLERPIVMGHSWGGATALTYGERASGSLAPRALILIDPALTSIDPQFVRGVVEDLRASQPFDAKEVRRRLRALQPLWSDEDVDLKVEVHRSLRPDTVAAIFEAISRQGRLDLTPTIARLEMPTLLCLADVPSGSIVPAWARERLAGLGHVEVTEFSGAGHSIQRTQPRELAAIVTAFVERHGA